MFFPWKRLSIWVRLMEDSCNLSGYLKESKRANLSARLKCCMFEGHPDITHNLTLSMFHSVI